jgi:inorganic pyrophosphatase
MKTVTIEISAFSYYKYEMKNGILVLDRPLNQAIPANYGYFNNTLAEDGDALDCFVLSKSSLVNGSECKVSILGAYKCLDQEVPDHKLICSLEGEIVNPLPIEIDYIKNYLETYKSGFKVLEFVGKTEAEKILANSSKVFLEKVDKLKNELVIKYTNSKELLFDDCE